MDTVKGVLRHLLFPPLLLVLALAVVSAAALVHIFSNGLAEAPYAPALYALSAYALVIICARVPAFVRLVKGGIRALPFGDRLLDDASFRQPTLVHLTLLINLAYAAFNLASGLLFRTSWMNAAAAAPSVNMILLLKGGICNMAQNNASFQYTYNAKQQEEIKQIRQKYLPKEDDKMEQLRKLDKRTTRPGTIASIALGIIGALLLGIGMCCTMLWAEKLFVPGIVIGVAGLAILALTYPLCHLITKKQREKLAPEILKLTDELME